MMLSRRVGVLFAFSILAACGGKIDDGSDYGSDSGVDSGSDSPSPPPTCKPVGSACSVTSDCCYSSCVGGVCATTPPTCVPDYAKCSTSASCCSQLCNPQTGYCEPNTPPPPPCEPDGTPCGSSSQCCSQACSGGTCGSQPPPPSCKPDGTACYGGLGKCCSNVCIGDVCGHLITDGGTHCPTGSSKLCDQCVAQACCGETLKCGAYLSCSQWLACIHQCEQQGNSAVACAQNTCGAPSTPAENALYACALQNCSTACNTD